MAKYGTVQFFIYSLLPLRHCRGVCHTSLRLGKRNSLQMDKCVRPKNDWCVCNSLQMGECDSPVQAGCVTRGNRSD